jgi:hypothetical protein
LTGTATQPSRRAEPPYPYRPVTAIGRCRACAALSCPGLRWLSLLPDDPAAARPPPPKPPGRDSGDGEHLDSGCLPASALPAAQPSPARPRPWRWPTPSRRWPG